MRTVGGIGLAALALLVAGCGGTASEQREAAPSRSATPTADVFDPCDLLTEDERLDAVGEELEYSSGLGNLNDRWTCGHGDAPAAQALTTIEVTGSPAAVWAQALPEQMSEQRDDTAVFGAYERAVEKTVGDVDALASVEDDEACTVWRTLLEELGTPAEDDTLSWSLTREEYSGPEVDEPVGLATSESCRDGIFASVWISSPTAGEGDATLKRVVRAHGLVRARAERLVRRAA